MQTIQVEFGVWDYLVFIISIVVCVGIGVFQACTGGKQKSTEEYLLGNRKLNMAPVALSYVVTFKSAIFLLGRPAEIYTYGIINIWNILAQPISILFAARIVVPLFHPLKVTSAYEYLEKRYKCKTTRMVCTVLAFLKEVMYMSIVLYGPALALETVMKLPKWVSMTILAFISMCYTALGGMKAVIWTDVVQCVVMNAGMIAIIIQGTIASGGIASVFNRNYENRRLNFFDFRPDPTIRQTCWSLVFGGIIRYAGVAFNQSSIQRISSVQTEREARRLMYVAALVFTVMGLLISMEGLTIFAFFNALRCDPIKSDIISNSNQLVPLMTRHLFADIPGLSGLFIAALFSASFSTISSGLSSLSAQLTEDIIKQTFPNMPNYRLALVAKLSVVMFGGLCLAVAFLLANVQGSLVQIAGTLLSAFMCPLLGIFLYSVFCPWATSKGAIIGGFIGLCFMLWISLGQNFSPTFKKQPWLPPNPTDNCFINSTMELVENANFSTAYFSMENNGTAYNYDTIINEFWNHTPQGLDKLYSLSFTWFTAVGAFTVILVGSIISLIFGYTIPEEEDLRYLLPIGDTLFPYFPKRARIFLNCGIHFENVKRYRTNDSNAIIQENENLSGETRSPLMQPGKEIVL